MLQVPTPILNQLALEQEVNLDPLERELFLLDGPTLCRVADQWQTLLGSMPGVDPLVVSAVVAIYPWMLARRALLAFLASPERQPLRQAMPEINSPEEGAQLGSLEYRLDRAQTSALLGTLRNPHTRTLLQVSLEAIQARIPEEPRPQPTPKTSAGSPPTPTT